LNSKVFFEIAVALELRGVAEILLYKSSTTIRLKSGFDWDSALIISTLSLVSPIHKKNKDGAMSISPEQAQAYWKENLRIIVTYLSVWFVVSYGCGILFVDQLDAIQFFGFPLGFWFGQQGSIFVFVVLIWMYVASMNKLDEKYDVHE